MCQLSRGYSACTLSPIDDGNVSKPKWDNTAVQGIQGICAAVHDINFGDDTDGAHAIWINFARKLQCITIGKIGILQKGQMILLSRNK